MSERPDPKIKNLQIRVKLLESAFKAQQREIKALKGKLVALFRKVYGPAVMAEYNARLKALREFRKAS
jgi:hypothetical protein